MRVFDEETVRIGILGNGDEATGWNVFWERPYAVSRDSGVRVDGAKMRLVLDGELEALRGRCNARAGLQDADDMSDAAAGGDQAQLLPPTALASSAAGASIEDVSDAIVTDPIGHWVCVSSAEDRAPPSALSSQLSPPHPRPRL